MAKEILKKEDNLWELIGEERKEEEIEKEFREADYNFVAFDGILENEHPELHMYNNLYEYENDAGDKRYYVVWKV